MPFEPDEPLADDSPNDDGNKLWFIAPRSSAPPIDPALAGTPDWSQASPSPVGDSDAPPSPDQPAASPPAPRPGLSTWPLPGHHAINPRVGAVGQGEGHFGAHRDPHRTHTGIDITAEVGTPVVAAGDGVLHIRQQPPGRGYGLYADIDHGDGVVTRYGHLDSIGVRDGDRVTAGQVIGASGRSGNVGRAQPHLHFEIRRRNVPEDPLNLPLLDPTAVP